VSGVVRRAERESHRGGEGGEKESRGGSVVERGNGEVQRMARGGEGRIFFLILSNVAKHGGPMTNAHRYCHLQFQNPVTFPRTVLCHMIVIERW